MIISKRATWNGGIYYRFRNYWNKKASSWSFMRTFVCFVDFEHSIKVFLNLKGFCKIHSIISIWLVTFPVGKSNAHDMHLHLQMSSSLQSNFQLQTAETLLINHIKTSFQLLCVCVFDTFENRKMFLVFIQVRSKDTCRSWHVMFKHMSYDSKHIFTCNCFWVCFFKLSVRLRNNCWKV